MLAGPLTCHYNDEGSLSRRHVKNTIGHLKWRMRLCLIKGKDFCFGAAKLRIRVMRTRQERCTISISYIEWQHTYKRITFDLCTKKLDPLSCSHCCSTADTATIYCLVVQTISLNTTQDGFVPNNTEDGCNATGCPEVTT